MMSSIDELKTRLAAIEAQRAAILTDISAVEQEQVNTLASLLDDPDGIQRLVAKINTIILAQNLAVYVRKAGATRKPKADVT